MLDAVPFKTGYHEPDLIIAAVDFGLRSGGFAENNTTLPPETQDQPRQSTAGYQSWRDLLFLHWSVDPDSIQRLLPSCLTVETFNERAWLGIVPFSMARIRPWWSPPVPGISWFCETNLRTYVIGPDWISGVWFLSLDANKRLAVAIGRRRWNLNYHFASMSVRHVSPTNNASEVLQYSGRRASGQAAYEIEASIDRQFPPRTASPGTLDHFLIERYRLYATSRSGALYSGMVHHEPYRFQPVARVACRQTLTAASGCPVESEHSPEHAVYSTGVDVRVSMLQRVD